MTYQSGGPFQIPGHKLGKGYLALVILHLAIGVGWGNCAARLVNVEKPVELWVSRANRNMATVL